MARGIQSTADGEKWKRYFLICNSRITNFYLTSLIGTKKVHKSAL